MDPDPGRGDPGMARELPEVPVALGAHYLTAASPRSGASSSPSLASTTR